MHLNLRPYAHIFNARGGKVQLILTRTPELSGTVISEALYGKKTEAKAAAKAVNAIPWNY